jgi:parvulin-like peptidyl-prolyl isomerase
MIELAGATALRDAFLDQRIAQALADRSITLSPDAIASERALLIRSLDSDPNTAERLLEEISLRQGLGPVRFEALMRRNAGLRALVQGEVRVTEEALARQHDVLHGPRRVCRVIAVASIAEAERLRRELDAGAGFADLAVRMSSDASGARGGLLAPISRSDPTWPQAFRDALFSLAPGSVSPPTLVDRDYLLIRLEEEKPADGVTLAQARADVEESLRRMQERLLMDEKARAFLAEIQPSFFDTGFSNAWRRAIR